MKKIIIALTALLTMALNANAMSYEQARREALFLTDKMAYELNLTEDQYEAAYEINLDYLLSIDNRDDLYGVYWTRRNLDLSYILLDWQYNTYCAATYFYRPLYWDTGYWRFGVYARYPRRNYFYYGYPEFWYSYRGGHSWRHNGGRSWYYGRDWGYDHRYGRGNRGFGMRDGFDRGDYRNRRPFGYSGRGDGRGYSDRGHRGDFDRGRSRDDMNNRFDRNNRNGDFRSNWRNDGSYNGRNYEEYSRRDRMDRPSERRRNDDFVNRRRNDEFTTRSNVDRFSDRRRNDDGFFRQSSTRSTATSSGSFDRRNNDRSTQSRPSGTFTPSSSSGSFRSSGSFDRPSRSSGSFGNGSRSGGSHGAGGQFGGRR